MTQDLTKITTPFGLLDKETQDALLAHGGPYEFWDGDAWEAVLGDPSWFRIDAYRVKPQPPKPRECVIGFHKGGGKVFLQDAEYAEQYGWTIGVDAFLFREVLE